LVLDVTSATSFRVGVQLKPQHADFGELREAWKALDDLEVDGARVSSLWTWDHFFPLSGDPDGKHFEGWTTLAAMAATTDHATVGLLVGCNTYRNADLVADMARTVDHISNGRAVLGLGAGWFERDYVEYGYDFGTAGSRLGDLEASLVRVRHRLDRLVPRPVQSRLPILIGGGGERRTLRLVAEHADMWNVPASPEEFAHKNRVLDEWCDRVSRDPSTIERTAWFDSSRDVSVANDYAAAGAQHVIYGLDHPFDLDPVKQLLALSQR
jgi:probable F420-dependent oxidoreductase